jgi:tellurite resistance protein
MSYYHKRQAIRLQARAEGRAAAETMIGQGDDIPTPEELATMAQKATSAARFRGCLSDATAAAFTTAFVKAFLARLREAEGEGGSKVRGF